MEHRVLSCGHQTLEPTKYDLTKEIDCPKCEFAKTEARLLKRMRKQHRGGKLTPHQEALVSTFCEVSYRAHTTQSEERAFINDGAYVEEYYEFLCTPAPQPDGTVEKKQAHRYRIHGPPPKDSVKRWGRAVVPHTFDCTTPSPWGCRECSWFPCSLEGKIPNKDSFVNVEAISLCASTLRHDGTKSRFQRVALEVEDVGCSDCHTCLLQRVLLAQEEMRELQDRILVNSWEDADFFGAQVRKWRNAYQRVWYHAWDQEYDRLPDLLCYRSCWGYGPLWEGPHSSH